MKINRRNNKKLNRFSIWFPILAIIGIGIFAVLSSGYQESWTYNWNGIQKGIKDSIQIAEKSGITSGIGSMGIATTDEVKRREWIMRNATESELLKLTEYPNGTVKAIAYEGLIRKKEFAKRTELTIRAIKDTTYLVDYQSGCIGWNMEIGEYLIRNVLFIDDRVPPPVSPDFGLTDLQKEKILAEFKKRPERKF